MERAPTIKSAKKSLKVKYWIRELMKAYALIVGIHVYL